VLIQAFTSYVRSIYLQKDKDIFKFDELPLQEFAESLGLPNTPHVKFVSGSKMKEAKNAPHPSMDSSGDEAEKNVSSGRTKHEKMFERKNQTVMTKHYEDLRSGGNTAFKIDEDEEDDGDIFTKKRKIDWDATDIPSENVPVCSL